MPLLHPLLIFWHDPWCHSFLSAALFPQQQKQAMFQSTACEEHDALTARSGRRQHQAWKQEVDVSEPSGRSPNAVMQKSCHPTGKETIETVTLIFDIGREHVGGLGLKNLSYDKVPSVNHSFLSTPRQITPHIP